MAKVKYIGDADIRRISKDDLKTNQEHDASFEGDVLEWNKGNKFTVEVPDADAAILIDIDANLVMADEASNGQVESGTPKAGSTSPVTPSTTAPPVTPPVTPPSS